MAIVLNRMWPFLRYRIRFSCFRKIKTFVDKIDAEGFRSNKKADGFPDFEPRLNGRIGISGFLGPVRRSARSASGSRTVTSSLVQGDNRFNPKTSRPWFARSSEARPQLSTLATSVAGLRLSSNKRASTRSGMSKPSVNQP